MPRAGFGQGDDYSGLFASLYNQDEANRERLNREAERLNDERKAAKDAEVFSKFQNGEITGAELLDHIRSRIAETANDPSENAKWKDALRNYSDSIADQQAEDAYANGGSIHDLIAYYRGRRAGLAKGTPEYSEVNSRLNQVIDEAQSKDLYLGAQRIQDKIDRGEATLEDLERFYKNQLRSMRPGSTLRDQTLTQLNTVQDNIHTRDINASIASLDYKLASGEITATDYNNQLLTIAAPYQASDPSFYYGLLTKGQNAVDTEVENAFSPTLPSQWGAPSAPSGTTPGSAPGGVRWSNAVSDDIRFVSQFDGSTFAKTNCVYASGAMLAQAMGVSDLSGGDLRWLSNDRRGGSTFSQLLGALGRVGLTADYEQNISFNDFLNKIKSGQPATLGGVSARLPDALHGAYQGKHSIYVDAYDPNKGFLVYDPTQRKPRWWSEEVLRNFSWGGGGAPNALFAPVGSVTPNRQPPTNISIFDQPKRPETPRGYGTGNRPGVEDQAHVVLNQTRTPPTPRTSPSGAPLPPGSTVPTTQDEARDELDIVAAAQERAISMAETWDGGNGSDTYADGTKLSDEVVRDALNEAYGYTSWRSFLASGIDNPGPAMQDALSSSARLGTLMLNAGDQRQGEIFNRLLSGADALFAYTDANSADPFKSAEVVGSTVTTLRSFLDALDPGEHTADEAVTIGFRDEVSALVTAAELAADPNADPTAVRIAIAALPPENRGIVTGIEGATKSAKGVADGTLAITVLPDSEGKMQFFAVPARQETLPNGQTVNVPALDGTPRAAMAPVAIMVGGKPSIIYVPAKPTAIPGLTQMWVTNAAAVNGQIKSGVKLPDGFEGVLTPDFLARLGDDAVRRLLVSGVGLIQKPIEVQGVSLPSYLVNGVAVPPQTYLQDPGTGTWAPADNFVDRSSLVFDAFGNVAYRTVVNSDGTKDYVPDFRYQVGKNYTVIDATGAPVRMQDFVNNGGIDAFDTGVYRDQYGEVVTDPALARMGDRSTLYSTALPSPYQASKPFRDFRSGERGDPVLGAPDVNKQTGFVMPKMDPSSDLIASLTATSAALGVNMGATVQAPAARYQPPAPSAVKTAATLSRQTGFAVPELPRIQVAPPTNQQYRDFRAGEREAPTFTPPPPEPPAYAGSTKIKLLG